MSAVKIVLITAVAVTVCLLGAVVLLVRYLDSEAFRRAVVAAASDAIGSPVAIDSMDVSLLRGATLRGVAVASPTGRPEPLLRAEALVVRPRLWPLLRRRLEIDEMRLEAPEITLSQRELRDWRRRHAPSRPGPEGGDRPSGSSPPAAPGAALLPAPLDIVVPAVTVTRGQVTIAGERDKRVIRLEGLELRSALSRMSGVTATEGRLSLAALVVSDRLVMSHVEAPLSGRDGEIVLGPGRGSLAGGRVNGTVTVSLAQPPRYQIQLTLAEVQVERLLADLGAGRLLSGQLRADATIEGRIDGPAPTGRGRAEVRQGQVLDLPVLRVLAVALQVPLLRALRFDEGSVDFVLAEQVLRTPALRFVSRDIELTGSGEASLATGTLDHRLTLAVTQALVARAPPESRAGFRQRPDGLMAVDFRVWGPFQTPRTDLQDRLLRGAAESLLRRGLRQLFR